MARVTPVDIRVEGARVGGVWGYTAKPGTLSHWPGGLCLAFPRRASVNGTLVMAPGDLNLTFKRYIDSDPRLKLDVKTETAYFADQASQTTDLIQWLGWPLAIAMAAGAASNRTMSQIHALLMISHQPLTAEQIMEELQISRGNVSMTLRDLITRVDLNAGIARCDCNDQIFSGLL
mgnify:CR=1 FL=1